MKHWKRWILGLLLAAALLCQVDWVTQISRAPSCDPRTYQYTRTNGKGASGDLSVAGAGKVITFTPCPGVIFLTDGTQSTRISGGIGTAESAPITATTCTPNAATGTITVTTVNPHTGAWASTSNTAGIKEAANALAAVGGGVVRIPSGTYNSYGAITIATGGIRLLGSNQSASVLVQQTPNANLLVFQNSNGTSVEHLSLSDSVSTTAGALVTFSGGLQDKISRCSLVGGYTGIALTSGNSETTLDTNFVSSQVNDSILLNGSTNSHFHDNEVGGTGTAPIYGMNIIAHAGLYAARNNFWQTGTSLLIHPGAGQTVSDLFFAKCAFDSGASHGVNISPSGTGVVRALKFVGCWSATNAGQGVRIDSGATGVVNGVLWASGNIHNNGTGGFNLQGTAANISQIRVVDNDIGANSIALVNTYGNVGVAAGIGDVQIIGNRIGTPCLGISNSALMGVSLGAGAGDYIQVEHNRFLGDAYAILNSATGTHNVIQDNPGYNPVGPATITVTASPFTYTAGASPEAVYITAGTITSAARGATTVCATVPCTIQLPPNGAVVVTYPGAAPTVVKDIQ